MCTDAQVPRQIMKSCWALLATESGPTGGVDAIETVFSRSMCQMSVVLNKTIKPAVSHVGILHVRPVVVISWKLPVTPIVAISVGPEHVQALQSS